MKASHKKYFLVFLAFVSLLSPSCNHKEADSSRTHLNKTGKTTLSSYKNLR
nr:hypothetical protein [Mucilaginibacter sp. X5P1]